MYDIRVVLHEDGWVYGLFCAERRPPAAPEADQSAAIAQCGIARTRDLIQWERLPNLITPSPQQRNVVLHPELVQGQYDFYTQPQDGFINAGTGGGIGLQDITQVIYKPGGYFMAPEGNERVGDVSNVLFCNGWTRMTMARYTSIMPPPKPACTSPRLPSGNSLTM